jgi:hypothetical protein
MVKVEADSLIGLQLSVAMRVGDIQRSADLL